MTKPVLPPRAGAPISQLIDDDTRLQLEALRDRLAAKERSEALARPREAGGRFAPVAPDQLVKDNATLRRMKDLTAAVGDMTVGRLLDLAQVPSVTQLSRRYSTASARTPLIGMLAGQKLGPQEAMLLGTTPHLGTGGALVLWQPKPLVPVSPPPTRPVAPALTAQAEPLRLTYTPAVDAAQEAPRAEGASEAKPGWWASLKQFGQTVLGQAKGLWQKLKTHPLVAPVLSWFAGMGFGPAHASMYGANPPGGARPGAPLTPEAPAAVVTQARLTGPEQRAALPAPPVQARLTGPEQVIALPAPEAKPITEATFGAAVTALRAAWPKGVDAAPAAFTRQAEALQAFKLEGLGALGAAPSAQAVSALLGRADAMHGKAGHSQNLGRLAEAFLGDAEVQRALRGAEEYSPKVLKQVAAAAPWLSLGELEAPVGLLAAPRRLSAQERAEHIAPRGPRAAALFQQLSLGGSATAGLLAGVGDLGAQSLGHQLVRLLDDTAALAAKPFCRTEDGINTAVLGDKLADNAARGAYDPELAALMVGAALRGVVGAAVKAPRADDLFVA